jgi:chemotaxis protein methyltransferase CheR
MKPESREEAKDAVTEVSKIVSAMAGIQLGPKQSVMVESRLKSRMSRLGCETFKEYLAHLQSKPEIESQALLSLLTTHHTYFFREFPHFEHLLNHGLESLINEARTRPDKTIRIWSAACSRGQEVYSLAMFFDFHLRQAAPDVRYEIWGTDVDAESVKHAQNGVYRVDELKQSPAMYVGENWSRGTGDIKDFTRIKKHIKTQCSFGVVNLLNAEHALAGKTFDVIFCRNVFIYFDQTQIQQISRVFLKHLTPAGFLFLGVSESLHGAGLAVQSVGPSIYRHKAPAGAKPLVAAPFKEEKKILDVLCIDDSPSILGLLSKILVAEQGFRVKKTAANGREAIDILKTEKFDVITLDLHMPELDGVGFLKEFKHEAPVVVVSSINRDDTSIAQQAIRLGAKDYIEKPSLQNLSQAGNEIRSKLRSVFNSAARKTAEAPQPASQVRLKKKSKVLIVDDSKTIRQLLREIVAQDPDLEVVGEAENPLEVDGLIASLKPDVLTLDIHMPQMDGVTLLKQIFPKYRLPTVMISSISREEGPAVLNALEAGAVDYIQKPQGGRFSESAQLVRDRIRTAAQANTKAVRRRPKKAVATGPLSDQALVLIGASTGGTEALRVVLEGLPDQIPPILIVQHIPPVFSAAFASRLDALCRFDVREAKDGDEIKANQVLIAPGGHQMGIKVGADGRMRVAITDDAPVNRHRPSVDYLFRSVRESGVGGIVAGVLTGMGADGARELKNLRDAGAKTFAQDEATSIVYGMPKEAYRMGGVQSVVALDHVATTILEHCKGASGSKKDVA